MKIELIDKQYDLQKVENAILDIVESNRLSSLATVTPDSKAHIATAFYVYDGELRFYILTPPETDHGRNLADNDSIALAIYDSHQQWTDNKQGLQIFGTAELVEEEDEVEEALELYTERFPAVEQFASSPQEARGLESSFYRITPERIKLFDEPNFETETWINVKVE